VAKTLGALALQWALWSHVRIHRHRQTAEIVDWSHCGHLRPTDYR